MTDPLPPSPRPVSLVAVAAIFILLSLFGLITLRVVVPGRPQEPQNEAPDHLPKELAWKATPATRRAFLAQLRKDQMKQGLSYGWVDKKAGVVQLPIGRSMELIAKEFGRDK